MNHNGAAPLKVLVLDDDPAFRRIVSTTFEKIAGVELVGAVATIDEAKRSILAKPVDLVSMDVVLKEGSSLELLQWARTHAPKIITVLLTAGQEKRASQSIDAILLGASHFVLKPSGVGAPQKLTESLERIVRGLRPLGGGPVKTQRPLVPALAAPRELIAIGASTGGPAVLLQFLKSFPQHAQLPLLVTQHLAAEHAQALVAMLNYPGGRKVLLAQHGQPILPNQVLVAGNDRHLQISRQAGQLFAKLHDGPPENFCRPAVDPMFRSVAEVCGPAAVGVVMTGMGTDGAKGAKVLRSVGAPVVVQDEATSIVWGMPGATVALDAANAIVPGPGLGLAVAGLINNLATAAHSEVRR